MYNKAQPWTVINFLSDTPRWVTYIWVHWHECRSRKYVLIKCNDTSPLTMHDHKIHLPSVTYLYVQGCGVVMYLMDNYAFLSYGVIHNPQLWNMLLYVDSSM